MKRCCATAILIAMGLSGCKVGPDYRAPQPRMPLQWSAPTTQPGTAAPIADLSRWWTSFQDPVLNSLIADAVAANLDLKMAAARLSEARALRRMTASGLLPQVGSSASYRRTRTSGNILPSFDTAGAGGGFPDLAVGIEQDMYQTGFDAGWEIDIFGGTRRAVEAADATVDAAREALRDVHVTLLAEIARNYIELRGLQRRSQIAQANVHAQRQTLELVQARLRAGVGTELDVVRAQAQVAATESQVPAIQMLIRRTANRLALLLGQHPAALWPRLNQVSPLPADVPQVPLGLPSDLLRRRPDLRRSERQLAAATARIGVATADLFPHFSLTGAAGLMSNQASSLDDWASRFWSIGPAIRWPLFTAGRVRANIDVQNARHRQALLEYEQTVLRALEDVENALSAITSEQARERSLTDAVIASRRAVDLANDLYSRGLSDFLSVLDAQRALYLTEDQQAQSQQALATDVVALYKALGGGWEPPGTSLAAGAER